MARWERRYRRKGRKKKASRAVTLGGSDFLADEISNWAARRRHCQGDPRLRGGAWGSGLDVSAHPAGAGERRIAGGGSLRPQSGAMGPQFLRPAHP